MSVENGIYCTIYIGEKVKDVDDNAFKKRSDGHSVEGGEKVENPKRCPAKEMKENHSLHHLCYSTVS